MGVLQRRLHLASALVLVLGLCSALLIYRAAGDEPDIPAGSQVVIVDGEAYAIAPADTKAYVHDLERFGGKATVLFVEFQEWFGSLWRGRSLAFTVAWIAAFVSLGLFLLAGIIPTDAEPRDPAGR